MQAVKNLASVLKPGGRVLVRDYGDGWGPIFSSCECVSAKLSSCGCRDLAQQRLSTTGRAQKLGDSFYMRMDGTKVFYFSEVSAASCADV